ncbi:MAG TPA: hypothetical protein VNN79_09075 [Actinomycetota bacterium]|nr:hypothetical protein [Actinomycetota bacterium]
MVRIRKLAAALALLATLAVSLGVAAPAQADTYVYNGGYCYIDGNKFNVDSQVYTNSSTGLRRWNDNTDQYNPVSAATYIADVYNGSVYGSISQPGWVGSKHWAWTYGAGAFSYPYNGDYLKFTVSNGGGSCNVWLYLDMHWARTDNAT